MMGREVVFWHKCEVQRSLRTDAIYPTGSRESDLRTSKAKTGAWRAWLNRIKVWVFHYSQKSSLMML